MGLNKGLLEIVGAGGKVIVGGLIIYKFELPFDIFIYIDDLLMVASCVIHVQILL